MWGAVTGNVRPRHTGAGGQPKRVGQTAPDTRPDTRPDTGPDGIARAGYRLSSPVRSSDESTTKLIATLEDQIDDQRAEIAFLRERIRE